MFRLLENTKIKWVVLLLGAVCLLNGLIATINSDTGLGVILTYAFGVLLIVSGVTASFLNIKAVQIIKIVLLTIFGLLLIGGGLLYIVGGSDTATYDENAVVVLGTTVKGDQPTKALQNRLDAALEYHEKNPEAVIIVTGGQGTDENATEASVMASYLEKAGVPISLIIKEDRATSTVENFSYSKAYLENDTKVCFITNDFHIYRAGAIAKDIGIKNATHCHGNTPWYMVVPNGFRESIVVLKMWFID